MTQGPVIAQHIDAEFGQILAAHPCRPTVIDLTDDDHPWQIPPETRILVTRAMAGWRAAPAIAPPLPELQWVQTFSAGIEIYPDWLKQGRILTNGRGITSPAIAEYVLAAILRHEKRLDDIRARSPDDWHESDLGGLDGKCLGLIGYGSIGQEIAKRARAFGMTIRASRNGPWFSDTEDVIACATPAEVIGAADHLVIAAPLTDATRNLVDARLLAQARPGLHLVNIARGGLVDQAALIAALDAGRIAFATLDVTAPEPLPPGDPLWSHPKVLLTPHVSYRGGAEKARFARKVLANLDAWLAQRPMIDVVDLARGY